MCEIRNYQIFTFFKRRPETLGDMTLKEYDMETKMLIISPHVEHKFMRFLMERLKRFKHRVIKGVAKYVFHFQTLVEVESILREILKDYNVSHIHKVYIVPRK